MRRFFAAAVGVSVVAFASAGAVFQGPTPYLSAADSPLDGGSFVYDYLDDFEDGGLNVPGISGSGGLAIGPGVLTDSVDGDDGSLDGSGLAGWSWYSGNSTSTMRFMFDGGALGGLPTHAGLVWTDVGDVSSGSTGIGQVTFEAFGPGGVSLGTIGPVTLGDGLASGGTAEDRYFGVVDSGGVSAIQLSMANSVDWEVDHIQFARVPEPATFTAVVLLVAGGFAGRRR